MIRLQVGAAKCADKCADKCAVPHLVLKALIRLYQLLFSPFLAALGAQCRFYPSCSQYASECLDQDPWPKALKRISRRLIKCGPWHPGGIDLP